MVRTTKSQVWDGAAISWTRTAGILAAYTTGLVQVYDALPCSTLAVIVRCDLEVAVSDESYSQPTFLSTKHRRRSLLLFRPGALA